MTIKGKEISRSHIIIGSVVIVSIVLIIVLYFIFRGDADNDGTNDDTFFGVLFSGTIFSPTAPQKPDNTIKSMNDEEEYLFRISSEPVVGATLSSNGSAIRYFKQSTGHVFENSYTGSSENRISNVTIPAILKVQWTPSKEFAVIEYYSDGELKRFYSHYKGTTTVTSAFLPQEINAITTSQVNEKIAYTVISDDALTLFTANPDNTGIKNIFTTPLNDLELTWPTANRIGLKTKSSAYAPSFLYTINPSSNVFTRIFANKEGLDVLWTPDGAEFLYMETNNEGTVISLRVANITNATETSVSFTTLPEKCTWAPSAEERILYCGIPQSLPSGINLPDAWWQGRVSFNDVLWRIHIDTGSQEQLSGPPKLDATNLFLAEDESFLFFTNKKDGVLWSLRLK
jgi:hypothetical protein